MATEPNGSQEQNTTIQPSLYPTLNPVQRRELEKDFYETYDVMTGVRIAATLGGFFGLMVILVLYKSKSKTERALEDPDFTAAAVAEVEEEERQLAAVLEATAYQQLNSRKGRRSLDTSSIPPGWIKSTARFSSVGGYSSLMEPPTRTHSRLPCFIDEDSPPEEDQSLYDDVCYNGKLDVPRRPSNITCSSSGSSYLERRDSAVAIGLPVLPGHKSKNRRRQSSPLLEIYDFYYPIDIKVIQPTPGGSPCGSDRALYDHVTDPPNLIPRLAPLASISSCNSSFGADYTDLDVVSYTCDSVFQEERDSTDDEVDQFSTDSDLTDAGACYNRRKKKNCICDSSGATPVNEGPSCVSPKISIKSSSKSSVTVIETVEQPESIQKSSTSSSINVEEPRAQETLF
ncbi:uncharacterized protein LOC123005833 [Tribolium madens]|uniref:uncharacterized protein LOC123005833 n=1 Tax=Tribolium madens TaxID=41895 RepID=UPI001CF73A3F|nr:uncharacterized protein LOC123005833 [Tribolium madens]